MSSLSRSYFTSFLLMKFLLYQKKCKENLLQYLWVTQMKYTSMQKAKVEESRQRHATFSCFQIKTTANWSDDDYSHVIWNFHKQTDCSHTSFCPLPDAESFVYHHQLPLAWNHSEGRKKYITKEGRHWFFGYRTIVCTVKYIIKDYHSCNLSFMQ